MIETTPQPGPGRLAAVRCAVLRGASGRRPAGPLCVVVSAGPKSGGVPAPAAQAPGGQRPKVARPAAGARIWIDGATSRCPSHARRVDGGRGPFRPPARGSLGAACCPAARAASGPAPLFSARRAERTPGPARRGTGRGGGCPLLLRAAARHPCAGGRINMRPPPQGGLTKSFRGGIVSSTRRCTADRELLPPARAWYRRKPKDLRGAARGSFFRPYTPGCGYEPRGHRRRFVRSGRAHAENRPGREASALDKRVGVSCKLPRRRTARKGGS